MTNLKKQNGEKKKKSQNGRQGRTYRRGIQPAENIRSSERCSMFGGIQ